jgi:hypothetical protein
MSSKSILKLLVLAVAMGIYAFALRHIPDVTEKPIDFGWVGTVAIVAVYFGLRWGLSRFVKPALVRAHPNLNLKHPLAVAAAGALSMLLFIPATLIVAVTIPGVSVANPVGGLYVMVVLSLYFAIIEGTWAYLDGKYKSDNS